MLAGMVLLLDVRRDMGADDEQMLAWLAGRGLPALVAVTKSDKVGRDATNRKVRDVEKSLGVSAIAVSVVTGAGKRELQGAIESLVQTFRKKHTA
jgi:GTP-binding protein